MPTFREICLVESFSLSLQELDEISLPSEAASAACLSSGNGRFLRMMASWWEVFYSVNKNSLAKTYTVEKY